MFDSLSKKDGWHVTCMANGTDEFMLEYALNNVIAENADDETSGVQHISVLLYFCTETPVADSEETIWLGGNEIRKDVIEYYAKLFAENEIDFQVIYDSDREMVSEEDLGYEELTEEERREFVAKVHDGANKDRVMNNQKASFSISNFSINNMPCAVPASFDDIQAYFLDAIAGVEKHIISFVNPEIFLQAEKNPFMMWYLQQTEYNFVDGNGLLLAINKMKKTAFKASDRYPGTDFFSYLPKDSEIRVFLYGASEENNAKAAEKIHENYPNVVITGRLNGYEKRPDEEVISLINDSNADILIVCLGAPRQECWILKNKENLNVKVIFGNGGSIDFWSGNVKRAPEFMIRHRMEWLFRLGQDFSFKRIRRQLGLVPFAMRIVGKRFFVEVI